MDDPRPLCVLLLDGVLEEVSFARRAQDLLRAPAVVALEPGRRAPGFLADRVARRLAGKLPGTPRVLVLVTPRQYTLARALLVRHQQCELWYAPGPGSDDLLARERASLMIDHPGDNTELWDRLEALGIARR